MVKSSEFGGFITVLVAGVVALGGLFVLKKYGGNLGGILGGGSSGSDNGGGGGGSSDSGGGGSSSGGGGGSSANPGQAITICTAGDWGSGRNSTWQATVNTMAKEKPNVVVDLGDKSYSGGVPKWTPVVTAVKKFAKFFGVQGNHDGSGYSSGMDAYSNSVQNFGDCSFMLLDTENGSGSITFAKANFAKMTQKWKFVCFHKPIKTPASKHAPDEGKIKALMPEFEKAKINMVLSGHNHLYARFAPVNGVTYMVVGTGGESHYSGSGGGALKVDAKTFGCLVIKTGGSLQCKFVSNAGATVDSFSIS